MTKHDNAVEGTGRIEAFSDGVIAIVITLLVLEIRIPEIHQLTNAGALEAIMHLAPKLAAFFVSFVTVAIFWVNHHHFYHPITKSDGALLWHNNHLLFWLAVIPFATAFVGDYPGISLVVAVYGMVLFMAAAAFALMVRHVFFRSDLLPDTITRTMRRAQMRHTVVGMIAYAVSVGIAFVHPYAAIAVFVMVPLYYFLPRKIAHQD